MAEVVWLLMVIIINPLSESYSNSSEKPPPPSAPPPNTTRKNLNADSKHTLSDLGEAGWGSIHRQRLTQIPREIRIKPAQHTHVIRKQLQRQHSQQRADLRIRFGDDDQIVAVGAQAGILFSDGDRACAADFHFVDATDDERHIVWSRHKDNWEALAHCGERTVFELGREHTFAMRVRDLFQLQRAFQSDGIRRAVAQTI